MHRKGKRESAVNRAIFIVWLVAVLVIGVIGGIRKYADMANTPSHNAFEPEKKDTSSTPNNAQTAIITTYSTTVAYTVKLSEKKPKMSDYILTEHDINVITMAAKMVYGEGRGVKPLTLENGRVIGPKEQKAAIVWTWLNRYDNESPYDWPHDLERIITQKGAFEGYDPDNPVLDELFEIAKDVYIRWLMEKDGNTDVGRVLPKQYTYFCSDGKGHNVFRDAWRKSEANIWDWNNLEWSPYES